MHLPATLWPRTPFWRTIQFSQHGPVTFPESHAGTETWRHRTTHTHTSGLPPERPTAITAIMSPHRTMEDYLCPCSTSRFAVPGQAMANLVLVPSAAGLPADP